MLSIDTGRLQLLLTSLSRLSTNALRNDLQCQLLYTDSFSHRQKIQQLFRYEHDLSNQLYHVKQYISKTLQEYECLEIKLQRQISILPTSHTLWKAQVPKGTILNHVTMDSLGMNVDVSHNISLTKDPKSYLTEGIIANIKADFYGLRYQLNKQSKYVRAQANLGFVTGEVDTTAKLVLYDKDKFDPELHLSVTGEASLVSQNASLQVGNQYIKAEIEEEVGLGVVYGEATAVLKKEEVTMKAEVGAAALKGEISGGISLFGLKIKVTGSGELGAVGAGIEFSSKENEFTFGGNASLIAGLGFKINVQY